MLLNIDAGELDDEPESLVPLAHLVHVAIGGHAGDATSLARTLLRALHARTDAGVHPSYPDREGFGRTALAMEHDALRHALRSQLELASDVAHAVAVPLVSMKPHGALYHAASRDLAIARLLVEETASLLGMVAIVGPPGSLLEDAATAHGLRFLREGFADRGLRADGSLVPRGEPGALLDDPLAAATQATTLAESQRFDTLCVHGDGPHALAIAQAVRHALDRHALARAARP